MRSRPFKVIGLMSGTSTDGISACLARISRKNKKLHVEVLSHETYPYEPSLRENILEIIHPSKVGPASKDRASALSPQNKQCRGRPSCLPVAVSETNTNEKLAWINILLGHKLAETTKNIAKKASVSLDNVDLIGSHGHTFFHCPEPRDMGGISLSTTLQLGEPSVIAYETGVTTVADFRMADVAAGGSGAPLVPYVDYLLFQDPVKGIALQNIGGIANVTFLPPSGSLDDIIAFDTGPGNMVIDRITWHITNGRQIFDEGGALAQKGEVNESLLSQLMKHPFLQKPLPKSTGREEFGHSFADNLYLSAIGNQQSAIRNPKAVIPLSPPLIKEDLGGLLATVTAFTAMSIAEGYKRFIMPHHPINEIILYGGGTKNLTLVNFLKEYLPAIPIRNIEELGIPSQAKEPMSFAVLAYEALKGHPSNVPRATGARDRVVLGKIVPGRNWRDLI
ncbi:MAG TPA: anhydro-N-acetylmuramic acid kinase [Candidatus Hypogeohydataceae bacterium YC40]